MLKKFTSVISVIILAISLSGCALMAGAVVGGVGTAIWLTGKMSDDISADYDRTLKAARRAIDSLDMHIDKETTTDQVTQFVCKYKDGRQVWIDIRRISISMTKVEIRVGMRGDKTASSKILETIKKYL